MTYEVAPYALNQIQVLSDFSMERWGERHTASYLSGLQQAFGKLKQHRQRPRYEVDGLNIYRMNYRAHCILFSAGDVPRVFAVFHQSEDIPRKLDEALKSN